MSKGASFYKKYLLSHGNNNNNLIRELLRNNYVL